MAVRMATFSKRLRTAIDMRGISQTELAKKTGISKSSISHYLKGDWEGKQDAVYALALALNVSEAWLKQNNQTTTSNFPCNFNFTVSNMNRFN